MRLNKNSMDKLFDLITMGVKYQFLRCKCPQQFLQVTIKHLGELSSLQLLRISENLILIECHSCLTYYRHGNQFGGIGRSKTADSKGN